MMIAIQNEETIPVIHVSGRIDANTKSELELVLLPIAHKAKHLIINLSECDYLSSAGIRTLLITEKILKSKGGGLFLCGLSSDVYQIIEMAGMLQIFHVCRDIMEANNEIVKLNDLTEGSLKWLSEGLAFEFLPVDNERKAAIFWMDEGIAGYDELNFAVGIGSPADSPVELVESRGVFVTNGHCTGFIPSNREFTPDFRIPQNPSDAGIFVNCGLSFGTRPNGILRLEEEGSLSLGRLSAEIFKINSKPETLAQTFMMAVTLSQDNQKPFISINLVSELSFPKPEGKSDFQEMVDFIQSRNASISLTGARFMLSIKPEIVPGTTLMHLLNEVLTIGNIVDIETCHPDDQVVNPISWVFLSDGLSKASSYRLKVEAEEDCLSEPHKVFLARRLYTDASRLVIKQLHGGYSAQTFQVTSYDQAGRKLRPTVLKISGRDLISRESDRCKRYANPYILNNSAMVLGTGFFGNTGALRYNFVGIGGEQTRLKWLTHYFNSWSKEQLAPLFDKIFLQILNPWYGQPIREMICPFRDHDPTFTFFPDLCETASVVLGISPEEQFFIVEETGQRLTNPYWFLKYEFKRRREMALDYYTSICHGDLNMQNILLDEDMNVYLIDFSETRPRSVVSDFARLEAIFMIEHSPMANETESEQYIRFITQFYDTVSLGKSPLNTFAGNDIEKVSRNVSLTFKMRDYAFRAVNGHPNNIPYCIALLEWILPIVCYYGTSHSHKRLSMIVAGLLCEKIL